MSARLRLYILSCVVLAAVVGLLAVRAEADINTAEVLYFGVLAFIASQYPLTLPNGSLYDVSFVIIIAALVASGPGTAVLATLAATLSFRAPTKRSPLRHLFNGAQLAISAGLAGLAYHYYRLSLGTDDLLFDGFSLRELAGAGIVAVLLATTVNFLVNTGLVSTAIALSERRPVRQVWRTHFGSLRMNYVAFALLGVLLAQLSQHVGHVSVAFLLMPLLVARHAFQAALKMQNAYDNTVRSLMTAIEAKDPYTRGHAERVSRLAEMTARAYGLPEDQCRVIRYAAMMHDVGKLTVLSKVLQKPGKLTPEEYDHMKIHPVRGIEILADIDLLREALVGVRHHHERMDGAGYPDGLVGEDIPLYARLIMVSDAFDSMTSTRVYRRAKTIEEAFVELHRCEGTQFDSAALAALEAAIQKNGWVPVSEFEEEEEEVGASAAV